MPFRLHEIHMHAMLLWELVEARCKASHAWGTSMTHLECLLQYHRQSVQSRNCHPVHRFQIHLPIRRSTPCLQDNTSLTLCLMFQVAASVHRATHLGLLCKIKRDTPRASENLCIGWVTTCAIQW